jgi:hypothetical protein
VFPKTLEDINEEEIQEVSDAEDKQAAHGAVLETG